MSTISFPSSNERGSKVQDVSFLLILTCLTFASIPLGPILTVPFKDGAAIVSATQILVALSGLTLLVVWLGRQAASGALMPRWPNLAVFLLVSVLVLAVPLIANLSGPALLAYFNFTAGTVGAAFASQASRIGGTTRYVEIGLGAFVLVGSAQLAVSFYNGRASGLSNHQNSDLPWGNSNYVAGILVVAALLLICLAQGSKGAFAISVVGIVAAIGTLSRGGVLAAIVGSLVFTWTAGGSRTRRMRFRVASIAIAICALAIFYFVDATRSSESRASVNVDTRFVLWRLAWESFLSSPAWGTGWTTLRSVSASTIQENSFAHNLVLSFLQIGGLCGFAYLLILGAGVVLLVKRRSALTAPVASALVISFTDPFLEGTLGALMTWTALLLAVQVSPIHRGISAKLGTSSRRDSSRAGYPGAPSSA